MRRTGAVEREAKRDAHEPGAKASAIAEAFETAIGAEQGFLRDVFGVCRIAQDAAGDAKGQRSALSEPLLEFAAQRGRRRSLRIGIGVAGPACFHCTGWLGQSQLLHGFVAERWALASCYTYQTPRWGKWFAGDL